MKVEPQTELASSQRRGCRVSPSMVVTDESGVENLVFFQLLLLFIALPGHMHWIMFQIYWNQAKGPDEQPSDAWINVTFSLDDSEQLPGRKEISRKRLKNHQFAPLNSGVSPHVLSLLYTQWVTLSPVHFLHVRECRGPPVITPEWFSLRAPGSLHHCKQSVWAKNKG